MNLTPRIIAEIAGHEGIVRECYKDSVGVWTWSVGMTNSCGHTVYDRYLDNPQEVAYCMEKYEWVLVNNYLPAVLEAFKGHDLTENELGGALSFHYNTGAIGRATWVKSFMAGDMAKAEKEIMNWKSPAEIIPRREAERDLIFHGKWGDGYANVYPVLKPSYTPDWGGAERVNVVELIQGETPEESKPPEETTPPIDKLPDRPEPDGKKHLLIGGFLAALAGIVYYFRDDPTKIFLAAAALMGAAALIAYLMGV